MPPERLYRLTSRYVDFMWPTARRIRRIPKIGRPLNWRLLIGDYSNDISDEETLRDWAKLDTFDMLAPRYDRPATKGMLERWCRQLGLPATVKRGWNGFEIHARRPTAHTQTEAAPAGSAQLRRLRPSHARAGSNRSRRVPLLDWWMIMWVTRVGTSGADCPCCVR